MDGKEYMLEIKIMESAFKLHLWWPISIALKSFVLSEIGYFMLRKKIKNLELTLCNSVQI